MTEMTMQTASPLVHQGLDATARGARELARMVHEGQMTVDAPYQRGSVWTLEQRRNLIRSLMLGVPVSAIILNGRYHHANWRAGDHEYAVIDGKQRLETVVAWFFGDLSVPASWFPAEEVAEAVDTEDGPYVTHAGLTVPAQRFVVNRFLFPVAEAKVATVAEEAVIFGLVNGAGVPVSEDDMGRAARIAEDL